MSGVAELTFTFLFPERMGDNGHEHIPPPPLSIVGPALQEPVAAVAAVRGAAVRRVMPWYEQENIQKKIPDEVKFYFKIDSEGCDEGKKKLKLQCQVCAGVSRTLTLGNGWSNATSHLKDAHPDYFNVMKQCKGDKSLLSRFFCTKTQSVLASNSCERFFSQCGHVWSKQRKSMSPLHLEMILFLKVNRNFWDQNLVKMAIAESRITADAPEDDEETSDEEPRGPQGFQLDL
jgi:hypothetical protein